MDSKQLTKTVTPRTQNYTGGLDTGLVCSQTAVRLQPVVTQVAATVPLLMHAQKACVLALGMSGC